MEKELGRTPGQLEGETQAFSLENIPQKGDIVSFPLPRKADLINLPDRVQRRQEKKQPSVQIEAKAKPPDEARVLQAMRNAVVEVGDSQLAGFEKILQFIDPSDQVARVALETLRQARTINNTKKIRDLLDVVRKHLIDAIIEGEGAGQLGNPSDVVPWEKKAVKSTDKYHAALLELDRDKDIGAVVARYTPLRKKLESITNSDEYAKAWDGLSDQERHAVDLLQDIRQIRSDDEIFRLLFDSSFRNAFKQRAKNDSTGVTEKRRQARIKAEEEKQAFEAKKTEIVKNRYGVEIPGKGSMRLELIDGRLWKVVEVLGAKELHHEESIARYSGNTYLKDLSNAPQWLRDAARNKGLI